MCGVDDDAVAVTIAFLHCACAVLCRYVYLCMSRKLLLPFDLLTFTRLWMMYDHSTFIYEALSWYDILGRGWINAVYAGCITILCTYRNNHHYVVQQKWMCHMPSHSNLMAQLALSNGLNILYSQSHAPIPFSKPSNSLVDVSLDPERC